MEDRKRPAAGVVDDVPPPPSKRQAVNGTSGRSKDESSDLKEEAWIEEYTKGAIYRQMNEYKREKVNLETRLQQLEKKSVDHDDHVRIVDAWLLQFLQEIELLAEGLLPPSATPSGVSPTGLFFKDSKDFQRHLGDKEKALSGRIESIFKRLSGARGEVKPEVAQLEVQIKRLLASQKELGVKIDRIEAENASLSEQYDLATLKVIKAERKLDRVRSTQVQKMEQKALATATTRASSAEHSDDSKEVSTNTRELQIQYEEAQAVVAKQKEQLQSALAEVRGLQDENSTYKARREGSTDDDYVRTEVFKQFKSANEDLIKRINNLEAINKQLREEAERYQAERAAYRAQLEAEAQAVTSELEDQIQQKDQDLTRIRSARDELTADLSMRKASQDQDKKATEHIQELLTAKDGRIAQLEEELERLRPPSEDTPMAEPEEKLDALSVEELRQRLGKLLKLEKDYTTVNKQLALIGDMYKKTMGLAHAKVLDFQSLEDRVAILTAEKSKADQKYFAARKDMDIRTAEVRTLRAQNGRSSEIISQLKDAEANTRQLVGALEKEVANLRHTNTTLGAESKKLEAQSLEATRRAELVKAQVSDLTSLVKAKDAANATIREQAMSTEVEMERLKVQVRELTSDCNKWREKCRKNSSEEEEVLRNLVLCSVCRSNFKNTILKGCGHVFCNKCIEDRITNRMRKCPTCNKAFDRSDAMAAHL